MPASLSKSTRTRSRAGNVSHLDHQISIDASRLQPYSNSSTLVAASGGIHGRATWTAQTAARIGMGIQMRAAGWPLAVRVRRPRAIGCWRLPEPSLTDSDQEQRDGQQTPPAPSLRGEPSSGTQGGHPDRQGDQPPGPHALCSGRKGCSGSGAWSRRRSASSTLMCPSSSCRRTLRLAPLSVMVFASRDFNGPSRIAQRAGRWPSRSVCGPAGSPAPTDRIRLRRPGYRECRRTLRATPPRARARTAFSTGPRCAGSTSSKKR